MSSRASNGEGAGAIRRATGRASASRRWHKGWLSFGPKLFGLLATVVAVAGLSAAGAWYFLLSSDAPPAVSLQAALDAAESAGTSSPDGTSTDVSSAAAEGGSELAGTWVLVSGANSFVGYRVDETLAGLGAATAVGRTQTLEGELTYDGEAITGVEVTANLTTLQSDKSMRDSALRMQALQTATYPEATFVLTDVIQVGEPPANGETITMTVAGELTLHGVTREIELAVQGALQGQQLVVVGSTEIEFADYGIPQPRAAAVLSVEDHAILEFQLVFAKA